VLSILVHWVKAVCDTNTPYSLKFWHETFRNNGHDKKRIIHVLNPPMRALPPPSPCRDDHCSMAFLPFVSTSLNQISRVLSNINRGSPTKEVLQFSLTHKDDLTLKTPSIYSISCECGKMYIGQTRRSIEMRVKEH
jgi:hypothetical protein